MYGWRCPGSAVADTVAGADVVVLHHLGFMRVYLNFRFATLVYTKRESTDVGTKYIQHYRFYRW